MNLKINKACDLNSISVLPPHARKSNTVTSGPQASYLRSQPSQQSISQGFSSQPAFFSQISQNSLDEYTGSRDTLERKPQPLKNPAMPSKACVQSALPQKTEIRGWNSVKAEQSTFIGRPSFIPKKYIGSCDVPERKLQPLKNPAMPSKACVLSALPPKMEIRGWKSENVEQSMFIGRSTFKKNKGKGISFSCARQVIIGMILGVGLPEIL
ncbi:hypothetical protein SLEP1_g2408 [Rubroshorea leprosula]|uniref:Uncharacterized protein n=1 Tax=Rubroshorea leprosula TaxID=152421 RepID=A0AAV5HNP1_9ROSI|nr:hypothetical protein SLEP1_g2408 [Rubroshorea leprosula]